MTATIDKFGRVLIPKPLRDRLGFLPGSEILLDVHLYSDGAPTLELRREAASNALEVRDGILVYTGAIDPAANDIVGFIKEQRDGRSRRLMGLDPDAP